MLKAISLVVLALTLEGAFILHATVAAPPRARPAQAVARAAAPALPDVPRAALAATR
jgi:hypothetical protein